MTTRVPTAYPCVLTTGELAKHVALARRKVNDLCDQGIIKSYRIPGGNHDRRIELADALDFAHSHKLPYQSLEDLAEEYGVVIPLRCPSLLVACPTPGYVLPILSGIWDPTIRTSPALCGVLLGHRTFAACLIDTALGVLQARDVLDTVAKLCPRTFVAILAGEDQEPTTWLAWGAHAAWKKPLSWRAVAVELYEGLRGHRTPPGTPTPPREPLPKAA